MLRDIYYMKYFNHPNIIKLLNIINERNIKCRNNKGCQIIGYNIKKYDNKLLDIINMTKNNINLRKQILYQILNGIKHIHDSNFIHNNLNVTNILIYGSVIKISNFSYMYENIAKESVNINKAPEFLSKLETDNKVDMWSIGCIMYQMITGLQLILPNNNSNIMTFDIKKLLLNYDIDKWELDLLIKLLDVNKDTRYSAIKSMSHEYFYDIYKYINIGEYLAYSIDPYHIFSFINKNKNNDNNDNNNNDDNNNDDENDDIDMVDVCRYKRDHYNLLLHSYSLTNLTIKMNIKKLYENIKIVMRLDIKDSLLFQIIYLYINYISKNKFINDLLNNKNIITCCINIIKCLNYLNGLTINKKIRKITELSYDIINKTNTVISPYNFLYIYSKLLNLPFDTYKLSIIIAKCCLFDIDLLSDCPKKIAYCSLHIANIILRNDNITTISNYIRQSDDIWVNLELLIDDIYIENPYILVDFIKKDTLFKVLNIYRLNYKLFI